MTQKEEYVPTDKLFESYDLGLVGTLVTKNYQLWAIDKEPNKEKAKFVFMRGTGMDDVIQGYWNDSITVPPRQYFDNLKMLKNRLHSSDK